MKYIRTKDGKIYAFEEIRTSPVDIDTIICYPSKETKELLVGGGARKFDKADILKVGDTIEELCDAVLIRVIDNLGTFPDQAPVVRNDVHDCLENIRTREQFGGTRSNNDFSRIVVACIWVFDSKGVPTLKNVAKMNEKGELELL